MTLPSVALLFALLQGLACSGDGDPLDGVSDGAHGGGGTHTGPPACPEEVTADCICGGAIVSGGYCCGAEAQSTPCAPTGSCTIATTPPSGIQQAYAAGGGEVLSDGGSSVTLRGVCWAASANPTTSDSTAVMGSGTGTFTGFLSPLLPDTTYHVRAYATNDQGTCYGEDVPFTSAALNATAYFVSTSGDDDTGTGTIDNPWKSWDKGFNAIAAGDTLYIRGGTYTDMRGADGSNYFGVRVDATSGTAQSHITVAAYPGEVPILDGSSLTSETGSNIGIALYGCEYWDFVGLNVTNFKQASDNIYEATGWYESDVAHITHTQCTNYHCGDGFVLKGTHDDIHYTNCDSYENADRYADPSGALPGSLANGFYCTPGAGAHIYYTGCRAWNNTDDGWDTFNSDGGYIEIADCWAFDNGWYGSTVGDGSGFKLGIINGPVEAGTQRTLTNCLAVGNLGPGYDQNTGPDGTVVRMALYHCVSAGNQGAFSFYYDDMATIRDCVSYDEELGDVGNGTIDHNSWQDGHSTSVDDFASADISSATGGRQVDGSLPVIPSFHLSSSASNLCHAGIAIDGLTLDGDGKPYADPPSMGAFEL